MKTERIVIKKYENRRLYDSSSSRYVNLVDVSALIRKGADVQVIDAKTGEDLTRATLTQIILEESKEQPSGLPLELLRQLIMVSEQARQDFLIWYLKTAFDTYQKVQDTVQSRLSDASSIALAPLESMRRFFGGAPTRSRDDRSEVAELRDRIAELEALLQKQNKPPQKQKAKKR